MDPSSDPSEEEQCGLGFKGRGGAESSKEPKEDSTCRGTSKSKASEKGTASGAGNGLW